MELQEFTRLVGLLREKGLHISAAESCTGGLFCAKLVEVPNASKVFGYGFVTYAAEAKSALLGVDPADIKRFGVVSEPVARQMAAGAAKSAGADVAVGITGYAGPKASENDDTVGTVCFGYYLSGSVFAETVFFGDIGRTAVREKSARHAAAALCRLLENGSEHETETV